MRPHADNLNGFFLRVHSIHQTVMYVYTARVKTVHIAQKLLIRRRVLEWVFGYKVYQFFCPFIQICGFQQRDVLCGSLCINNGIHYHSTSEAGIHSDNGVSFPDSISLLTCGSEDKYSVSIIPFYSSSLIITALPFLVFTFMMSLYSIA